MSDETDSHREEASSFILAKELKVALYKRLVGSNRSVHHRISS